MTLNEEHQSEGYDFKKLILTIFGFLLGVSLLMHLNYQGSLVPDTKPNSSQGTEIYSLPGNITDHIWSPDGTKLAYINAPRGQVWNCTHWVANRSGYTLVDHTLLSSEAEAGGLEDWKDDWILFKIRHEEGTPASYYGRNELWKIRYNGTGLTQVTFTETNGIRTTWAYSTYTNRGTARYGKFIPGTNLVYFNAHDGNGWYKQYVCNDDGTDVWYHISNPDYGFTYAVAPTSAKLFWGHGA